MAALPETPSRGAETPLCVVHQPEAESTQERRLWWVVGLSLCTMAVEVTVGLWSGSLALEADGWHMGTHVGALGLSAWAAWYARRRASARQFAFGTGRISALAAYTSAWLLLLTALSLVWQAAERWIHPTEIRTQEALVVTAVGLLVNGLAMWLLHGGHHHGRDPNRLAAFVHVASDAMTSVLALGALAANRAWGWTWVDPTVALLGAVLIARWGGQLIWNSGRQLVDMNLKRDEDDRAKVQEALESLGDTVVTDLHLWSVGPSARAVVVSVTSSQPLSVDDYRGAVHSAMQVEHVTVEVRRQELLPLQRGSLSVG